MADDRLPPPIYGVRGEEFQLEPDAPRRLSWRAIVALLLLGAVIGALVG